MVDKSVFRGRSPERGKVRIAAYLLVILMVGLGGLEPPTSPLSGARSSHLSYRPFKTVSQLLHNSFILRCLSVCRNCVQIRALCTRQQFLYHFSLLSVFKVRVVARDSQVGMSNLILHEVAGHLLK